MSERRNEIIICILLLFFCMISVGYGFWTDHLELKGNADIKLSFDVIDDIPQAEEMKPIEEVNPVDADQENPEGITTPDEQNLSGEPADSQEVVTSPEGASDTNTETGTSEGASTASDSSTEDKSGETSAGATSDSGTGEGE